MTLPTIYGEFDSEVAVVCSQAAERIRTRMKRTAEDIIEIGGDLTLVKGTIDHGLFLKWVEAEFEMSERTARNFMAVYEKFKTAKFADLESFQPSALYALTTASDEVVGEAMEMAKQGKVTPAAINKLKEEKKKLKEKYDLAKAKVDNLDVQNAKLHGRETDLRDNIGWLEGEIERLSEELKSKAPSTIEINKHRVMLVAVWEMAPPEDRQWFKSEYAS